MASSSLHWSAQLIGKPYRALGRGLDGFDCWGLCKFVWKERLGIDVPDLNVDPNNRLACRRAFRDFGANGASVGAETVTRPAELDAVYMSRKGLPDHIGIYVCDGNRGGVLHAIETCGVTFMTAAALRAHGFKILSFHRLRLNAI